jgi:multiple sugar transport system permease protein
MFKKYLRKLTPYLFITPHLIFFTAFLAFPAFYGIYISLHKWEPLSFNKPFIGLTNYQKLFTSGTLQNRYFWNALVNTLQFVFFSVPALVLIGLLLAILVDSKIKYKGLFRSVFYTPVILSVTSVTLIWMWMLDSQTGLINYFFTQLGLESVAWLSKETPAWISLVVTTVWWTAGHNMLLFLAGLQDIPQHLYEAAKIDGASIFEQFWYITLPSLKPTTLFVTVMTTVASFNVFGQPFMMTKGGPGRSTQVAIMYIQQEAFTNYKMGSAAAMAIIVSLFIIVIGVFQFKIMSSDVKY